MSSSWRASASPRAPATTSTQHSDRIESFELAPHDVSSTVIRARLARGEPVDGLVAPAVAAYIDEHGLYRPDRRR